ncbi:MAG: DUF1415 family protein [Myxococcales bacterium]|nr:DUF1415 family protein [Myxococcales bacterium]
MPSTPDTAPTDWLATVEAALDRNDRFLADAIEGLDLCPFARPARTSASTARFVVADTLRDGRLEPSAGLHAVFAALATSPRLQVVQVIFPRVDAEPRAWVDAVKALTAALNASSRPARIAAAAFHPELSYDAGSAARLIPLFRRAPDPMIQWIRLDALDRVRAGRPDGDVVLPDDPQARRDLLATQLRASLGDTIAAANAQTAERFGVEAIVALLASLRGR